MKCLTSLSLCKTDEAKTQRRCQKETSLGTTLSSLQPVSFWPLATSPSGRKQWREPVTKEVQDPMTLCIPFKQSGVIIKVYPPQTAAVCHP